jgi:hypothetical protein
VGQHIYLWNGASERLYVVIRIDLAAYVLEDTNGNLRVIPHSHPDLSDPTLDWLEAFDGLNSK